MKITIIHPFTPKAAGAVEASVATYHSQPHLKALQQYAKSTGSTCSIEYFTPRLTDYSYRFKGVDYNFYKVDYKLNGDHKKWKKQTSKSCIKHYAKDMPDVTIINMSGHSSKFSHQLASMIKEQGRNYVAMLGGQHYSDTEGNREYYQNANHILVHTQLQKSDMQKMQLFKDLDIRVFPLGVDCDIFKPSEHFDPTPKLLYVGRILEWKRIHLAIEAIDKLVQNGHPHAILNIIGPVVSKAYYTSLLDLVHRKSLQKNVQFLGHKEHSELPEYFQSANLFTLPSDKETFGMVMIEAMACGTPVAGIDCPGGPKDVITHNFDGLLSTPENYSQTILDYYKDIGVMKKLKTNAIKKAVDNFGINETYKVLKQSIHSCIKAY